MFAKFGPPAAKLLFASTPQGPACGRKSRRVPGQALTECQLKPPWLREAGPPAGPGPCSVISIPTRWPRAVTGRLLGCSCVRTKQAGAPRGQPRWNRLVFQYETGRGGSGGLSYFKAGHGAMASLATGWHWRASAERRTRAPLAVLLRPHLPPAPGSWAAAQRSHSR